LILLSWFELFLIEGLPLVCLLTVLVSIIADL
jgi:hypothetical protein